MEDPIRGGNLFSFEELVQKTGNFRAKSTPACEKSFSGKAEREFRRRPLCPWGDRAPARKAVSYFACEIPGESRPPRLLDRKPLPILAESAALLGQSPDFSQASGELRTRARVTAPGFRTARRVASLSAAFCFSGGSGSGVPRPKKGGVIRSV